MPVHLLVTFTTQPGKAAEFAASWKDRLPIVHAEPGCEQYELFLPLEDASRVLLVERWTDAATLQTHSEVKDYPPIARDLLAGPTEMQRFEV